MKKNYIFLLVVSLISATLASQTPYDSFAPESTRPMLDNSLSSAEVTAIEQAFKQSDAVDFQWGSFSLLADSGTLVHDLPFSFALIPNGGEHRMPSYMVNMTGENVGAYRLLPNGVHFSEPATIAVPYDDFLLPMGYNPKDIKTYYFDEELAQWKELERVGVDTLSKTIISHTTHFTEFANAVIKLPEVPEMKTFVPTAMQDLPDVNPLQGIPMIAPPTANNRGTAELTYPIELPAGRNGMQPNIDLHYSSAGGNDILGVGWSFAQPAITIDTRWGVPRYDDYWETEAYLLNGGQIVLHDDNGEPYPLPHQAGSEGFTMRKYGAVEYFARDTKNQDRIVRHGDKLNDIWWEVTDRFGIVSYYGYDPIAQAIDNNSVVRIGEKNNAIGYWALTATIDIFGNYVHYQYAKDHNEVYLVRIDYTGNLRTNYHPTHTVLITYSDNSTRPDQIVSGRLGTLQKKRWLIDCITILYGSHPNAQYVMNYDYSQYTLFKKRLSQIIKYDIPDGTKCGIYEHIENSDRSEWIQLSDYLEIHRVPNNVRNAIINSLDNGIAEELPGSVTTFNYQDAKPIANLFSTPRPSVLPRSFSKSSNHSWSIGGTATVGLGNLVSFTNSSVGANYTYSHSKGSVSSMMMDLDGDGLPDVVYQHGNDIYYYKQLPSGMFADSVRVPGLSTMSREVSSSHSFGVQADFLANFSYNPSITSTYTDIYFTDVNADGLPDLVTTEGVKMNHLVDGIPSFDPLEDVHGIIVGNARCGFVSRTGEVDERLECTNEWVLDTVVLWHSQLIPTSSIHIDTPIDCSNNPDRPHFDRSDDITTNYEGRESYFYTQHGITIPNPYHYIDIPAHSGSPSHYGESDTITYTPNLNPIWTSSDYHTEVIGDSLYVYHLETYCHEVDTLPNVDIVRVWVAPHEGEISLNSTIRMLPDSSFSRQAARKVDGVKYYVQHNTHLLDSGAINANTTDTITLSYAPISVQQHDVLLFRLSANQNRRFDDTDWEQTIQYVSGDSETYNSAADYVCTGKKVFTAPCSGSAILSYTLSNQSASSIGVSVKKNGNLLTTLSSYTTSLSAGDKISFEATYSGSEPQWSDVHIFPHVRFLAQTTDPAFQNISDTLDYYPDIDIPCSSILPDTASLRHLFGLLHKGWGQFAYNNLNREDTIDYTSLSNTEDIFCAQMAQDSLVLKSQFNTIDTTAIRQQMALESLAGEVATAINNTNTFNPLETNSKWIAMHADSRTERWVAYGNLGAIGKHIHSTAVQLNSELINGEIDQDIEYDSAIPVSAERGAPVTTVRKKNFSVQHCISAGFAMISGNFSFGTYDAQMDYMDMNGDGFPDFVSSTSIQYSTPWGGIEGGVKPQLIALGSNYHTYSQGAGFSRSKNTWEKITTNGVNKLDLYNSSLGLNIGEAYTYNHGRKSFLDINADGLPDMVNAAGDSVWYNLGYSFSAPETLSNVIINEGVSHAVSASAGAGTGMTLLSNIANIEGFYSNPDGFLQNLTNFSLFQFSLSGGISSSVSSNTTVERMTDINGDGYPDKLFFNGATVSVSLYNGGTSSEQGTIQLPFFLRSTTGNLGVNAGVTVGFSPLVWPVKLCIGVQTTPWAGAMSRVHSELIDMNGDGFVDYVYEPFDLDGNAINASVYYNQNGLIPVNMLTAVTNPTGQRIELSYEQTTPSVEQRGRTWRLAGVKDSIIATDETACHRYAFSYKNPYHDNFERTDFGYDSVTTIDNRTKVFTETFSNANFISKGEKMSDLLTDTLGRPYIGHSHCIGYKDIYNNPVDSPLCNDASIRVDYDYYQTDYYEGLSSPSISTRYRLEYDRFHNLISHIDEGDRAITSDDWVQHITYDTPNNNRWHYNLISLPVEERVTSSGGTLLRLTQAMYNAFGEPEWIIRKDSVQGIQAETYIGYNEWGNIAEISFPEDASSGGERAWLKFEYDHDTHTKPEMIYNPFMEYQFMHYDSRFGFLEQTIDPSGNAISYEYDKTGRLINVLAPRDVLHGIEPYTVHYRYCIPRHDLNAKPEYIYPYVIKASASEGIINIEASLYDARGHVKQKKRLSTLNNNIDWIADGVAEYDAFYRLRKTSLPFKSTLHVEEWDHYAPSPDSMVFRYDVLDRPVYQRNFDGTSRVDLYSFDIDIQGIHRLKHAITDENNNTSYVLQSPQEWTIWTSTPDSFVTHYKYNPLGELISATDADGYKTFYFYDAFGNIKERFHPDAGITRWTYAPAGNIEAMQTNVHLNNIQSVEYKYDNGRLRRIFYPEYPENDVTFEYDFAGRIKTRTDGVGYESYYYDELSNPQYSHRHIIIPTETQAYQFTTRHHYDSFGRIRNIIYPDGDTVRYQYYATGELLAVSHQQIGYPVETLMSDIQYNVFGQQTYQLYGNGVESFYTYLPQRQWLTTKQTRIPSSSQIQELHYTYDDVGNITQIKQNASSWSSLGGSYTNDYTYDRQYRLLSATETSSPTFNVAFSADYSPAGRLGHDFCMANYVNKQLTYGYDINGLTHQPRVILDGKSKLPYDLYWDANGNLAQVVQCDYSEVRFHEWDDSNRLHAVIGPTQAGFYGYDGNGDRVWKLTGACNLESQNGGYVGYNVTLDDAVLYPNPYLTITPTGYTKHYYIGSERIATALGEGGWGYASVNLNVHDNEVVDNFFENYMNELPCEQCSETENEDIYGDRPSALQYSCKPQCLRGIKLLYAQNGYLYNEIIQHEKSSGKQESLFFTHSDHLGSASWITDGVGNPVQYIHYAPYGELLANQSLYGYDERYKFTGKERDAESGYDYFGARYLLSDAGIWLSVDPLADKYPGISPYAYCAWNPIKYLDPDGRGVFPCAAALRQAGEEVVNNPRYLRNGKTTYCNMGAQAINAQAGDQSLRGRANEMGSTLRNPEIATEVSQSEALEYANMGAVVFASYVSDGSEPGHIAVVAPTEDLTYSPSRKESVVSVFNVGAQNGEMPLSKAFGKRSVGMYILNNDLNTINEKMSTIDGGSLQEIVVSGNGTAKVNAQIKAIEVKSPNVSIDLW